MKTRKIFLEGYIELSPVMFARTSKRGNFVSLGRQENHITIGMNIVKSAEVNIGKDGVVKVDVYIEPTTKQFAVVFGEDGKYEAKRYSGSSLRLCNTAITKALCEYGFEAGKRYKANSPEEGVVIVTQEEA